MKKIVYALFLLFFSVCTLAQTQQGYVKTKGRMASNGTVIAGVRLSGVTVQVKGRTAVLSQSNGTFSFPIPSQNYYLQSVQKQGYVLTDPDVLSKQYAYSKNPWVLVLETPNQLADDKLAAERKIRRTLQRQLQEKEDEIESLKVQQKLSEEEYRKQLQDMYALQESNEKLISEMADRYSRLDFDEVNEFNRRISQLILDGKLMEADSMLNTKGDIVARTAILRQHQKANAQEEQEIQKKQKRLEKSKALIQKELEDLAQDCYRKFEIFKMQHQNDSAAYYIEYRANLDTTNVKWQNEAGDYVVNFMADYQLGHNYYKRALLCAQSSGTDQYVLLDCYNNLGLANYFLGNNAIAMDYYMQCFKICHGDSLHLSTIYKNIGNVYYNKGAYDDALSYFKKALELVENMMQRKEIGWRSFI